MASEYVFGSEKDGFRNETVHFIWAGPEAGDPLCQTIYQSGQSGYRAEIIHIFYKTMIEHGIDEPFMITFLGRCRHYCKAKEDYVETYKSPYYRNTQMGSNGIDKEKDSLGNELENFIEDLKNNKYCFENSGLDSMETNRCFHFAMLTDQEEKDIQNPDSDFLHTFINLNPDVPKTDMTKSDSKHKYLRSFCIRATYII